MSGLRLFLFITIAVVAGIMVYAYVTKPKNGNGGPDVRKPSPGPFFGPDIDPITGAYLPPNAGPGTVQFPAQGN